jgi:hypothetical protein
MIGLIKNEKKVPFISLEKFIDESKLHAALEEMETYKVKQDTEGVDIFVGYNGTDWASDEFQKKQKENLPLTTEYVNSFCNHNTPYNIRYSPKDNNIVLLHQDDAAQLQNRIPVDSLIPNYKDYLTTSIYDLLKDKSGFKIVDNENEVNPIYNGLDFDYASYLKNKFKDEYATIITKTYKLHLTISEQKTMFIYDNVTDTIHNIESKATVFNAKDYHDTLKDSWGISIQFPMHCDFLKNELKEYCELVGIV